MYITSREKTIIELIIKTSGKHTASSISGYLNVSVRTVHRDLKSIEKILKKFGLQLNRNTNEGLSIEGKNEQIFRLMQHLAGIQPIDRTPKERKLLLLLSLLKEEGTHKIQVLANELDVSISTLTADLEELSEWLMNFHVRLKKKRGVGVQIDGTERDKRKALATFILVHFNEELFESIVLMEKGNYPDERILHYFRPEYLLEVDRTVNSTINNGLSRLADSDYIGLVINVCIALQRTEDHFLMEDDAEDDQYEITDEFSLIKKMSKRLENKFSIALSNSDLTYLAVLLKGSKLQAADSVPYDRVDLRQMVKNLIQHVSAQIHVDLTNDFSLYQGLLAHMEPSLYRAKQKIRLYNPLTEEIKRKYPVLFMAVKNSAEKELKEMGDIPDDEIAFIVLHFGSALLMQEEETSIKALIVCPTGIGTSKMLASRLKKEILEIDSVEIKSMKELQQQETFDQYDIILSTVRLPFLNADYILVTPLLSEEDIAAIRNFLKRNISGLTKDKYVINKGRKEKKVQRKIRKPIQEVLAELKDVERSIESVLHNFRFYRMPLSTNHVQVIKDMVYQAERENLLSDANDVIRCLEDREKKGGLGIPYTGMGIFHCRHEKVKELIFQICHISQACVIRGMDGNEMPMKNLLLMLAPKELSLKQQEIVSLISTSLIEDNEAIMIFSSSDEKMIRSRLEEVFLNYLHTNLMKE
ncbi:BglG family transcription antiterminator [Fictibacillus sp. Mic-4]|uniref:BglG family transcription antiterminator n=1 Tax=Fictibacillus sp. Mic-4 TaxID=3132826 RepID=UPI003CF258FE